MGKDPEGPAFVTASPGGDPCVRADMCARHSLPPSRSLILAAPGRAWLTPVHITTKCKKAGGGHCQPSCSQTSSSLRSASPGIPCPGFSGTLGNAGYAGQVGRPEERCQGASSSGHHSFTVSFLHSSGSGSYTIVSPGLGLVRPACSGQLGSLTPFDLHLPCSRPQVRSLPSPGHA